MFNLRGISIRMIAAGGLAILAGGGAYYYYVYLPQMEQESAMAAQKAAKPPARVKAPKPPVAPAPKAASAVPAVSELPVPASGVAVAAPVQPAITTPGNVAIATQVQSLKPALEPAPEPVKAKTAAKKPAPKKPRIKTPPTRLAPSQQTTQPLPAVLPESGVAVEPAPAPRIVTPKYNDVLTAVLRSDREGVKQLLDMGRWVDKPGSSGLTPLMAAVMNRDTQMVELLLDRGAVPGPQALKLARKNKDDATVSLLERHGAR
jgi:hypothetical protein